MINLLLFQSFLSSDVTPTSTERELLYTGVRSLVMVRETVASYWKQPATFANDRNMDSPW